MQDSLGKRFGERCSAHHEDRQDKLLGVHAGGAVVHGQKVADCVGGCRGAKVTHHLERGIECPPEFVVVVNPDHEHAFR